MLRKYEKKDCKATAKIGSVLKITDGYLDKIEEMHDPKFISCVELGSEKVVFFAEPEKLDDAVWVPYNSRISLDGDIYKVLRGRPFIDCRGVCYSTKCLQDGSKDSSRMENFDGKIVRVEDIGRTILPDNIFKPLARYASKI